MGLKEDGITLQGLAERLREKSEEICALNKCTELDHYCESYAYINAAGELLDICASDFFCGSGAPYAAVSLPWTGDGHELRDEVDDQIAESQEVA